MKKFLNKLSSCACLSLKYRGIILGFLTGEMDLQNYVLILGKTYFWTCRCEETKPSLSHFERILLNKINMQLKSIPVFLLNRIISISLRKKMENF